MLRLIRSGCAPGVLEEGRQIDAGRGTAQGSVISPMLANVYLHYVLDLWVVKKWRPQEARGDLVIARYADDYVAGFEHRDDAERFLRDRKERFRGFELELNADKTRLIEFGRYAARNRPGTGRRATGDVRLPGLHALLPEGQERTLRIGPEASPEADEPHPEKDIREDYRRRMHDDVMDTGRWLGRVLRGWLNYYAVPTSYAALH